MDIKEILEKEIDIRINNAQDLSSTDPKREYYLGQDDAYSEVLRILGDLSEKTRYVIEKELRGPEEGPLYHLYRVSEEDGKELLGTFDDIAQAARELERKEDLLKLEMAYKEHPESFLSSIPSSNSRLQEVLRAGEEYAEEHDFSGSSLEELYVECREGKVLAFMAGVLRIAEKLGIKETDIKL